MKKILIILATGGLICAAGTGVALADSHEGGALEPASPIEIYACNFNEGKGPADLDKAVAAIGRALKPQERAVLERVKAVLHG